MVKRPVLTPEQLRQLLRYEPDTGRLFWRTAPVSFFVAGRHSAERKCLAWNGKNAGKEALCYRDSPDSYAYGEIFGHKVYAHRVIVAMTTGAWPDGEVDHIDGDRSNNRENNLRAVTRRENALNKSLRRSNKSGAMGVYWDRARKKWAAEIFDRGVKVHIGRFDSLPDAKRARAAREAELGYHPNHGRQPLTLDR